MNTVTAKPQQQIMLLDSMASRAGLRPQEFADTVRKTCGLATATNEEFAAFLLVAREYDLNPILREIYAFPRKGGGVVPILSVDGWISLINRQPQYDGVEFDVHHDNDNRLIAVTCRMFRKDRAHPVVISEYLSECIRPTEPWKMPHRMLRHKALVQAARVAFGFSNVFDEDEGQKIADVPAREIIPAKKLVAPPVPPPDDHIPDFGGTVVEQAVGEPPEHAGATGSGEAPTSPQPPSAAATQKFRDSVKAGEDEAEAKAEAIAKILALASDPDVVEEQERLENLDQVYGFWQEGLDPEFHRELFSMATKVAKRQLTVGAADKYLKGL